ATSSKKYVYTSSAVNPSPNDDGSYGNVTWTSVRNCNGCGVKRNPVRGLPVTFVMPLSSGARSSSVRVVMPMLTGFASAPGVTATCAPSHATTCGANSPGLTSSSW